MEVNKSTETAGNIAFGLFLLVVFSLGLMKPTLNTPLGQVTPTELIFAVFGFGWIAAIVTGARRLAWQNSYLALLLYFLTLLASAVFSRDHVVSFGKLAGEMYLLTLAISTASLVTTFDKLRLVILAWLYGSILPLVIAAVGIVLFYLDRGSGLLAEITHHYGSVPVGNFVRISSTFVTPSMLCNYLSVSLVLTLICMELNWMRKSVGVVFVLTIVAGAVSTVSILLGGVFLILGAWVWLRRPGTALSRLAVSLGVGSAIAFVVIAPFALGVRSPAPYKLYLPIVGELDPSARLLVWSEAWNTFTDAPLTGAGIGRPVASVLFQNLDGTWSMLTDAHNTFLNVAAESGLLGLFGLGAVIYAAIRSINRDVADGSSLGILQSGLCLAFVSAFLYQGLTGSFDDARHLWVLIGLMLATGRLSSGSVEQGLTHGSG